MSTVRGGGSDAATGDGDSADGAVSTVPVSGVWGMESGEAGGEGEETDIRVKGGVRWGKRRNR